MSTTAYPGPAAPAGDHPARRAARRAVVIGAGLGGLAAAIRLLALGYRVVVVESQPSLGGRAGQIAIDGFTFDTGPSLITMPQLIDDLFVLAGARESRPRLHSLDPFYQITWRGEERRFLFRGSHDGMLEEIGRFSAVDARRYDAFLAASRLIYERAILDAGRRSFLGPDDLARLLPTMVRLGALRSVEGFVGRYFREPHVRQAFGFHSLFIGGDPARVPAVYAALAYLQIAGGVWYAEGGVYALVQALGTLVRAGGGEIRTGESIASILHDGRRVQGVRTATDDVLPADVVVSNADVVTTHERLLGRRIRRPRLSMSCFLLYLGTNRCYPRLHHHTLLVGPAYQRFIREVTLERRLPTTLCLYVHAPSRTEAAMAPPGGESLTVLLPVPNLAAPLDWGAVGDALRERIVTELEAPEGLGLAGLRDAIRVERRWTPSDYHDRFGATDGNAFAAEPTLRQSASFRQPNRDRRLAGLYYVGAGTHPGAGIPGVLLGAQVTADLIAADARAERCR